MKTLSKVSTWDLQKELDRRNAMTFQDEAEQIGNSLENYRMGLIDANEVATQVRDICVIMLKKFES